MAIMPSRYAGKCKVCKVGYLRGDSIFWSRATGAMCLQCYAGSASSSASQKDVERQDVPVPSATAKSADGLEGKALRRWDSWAEYVAFASKQKDAGRKGKFYGNTDFSSALELARKGWSEPRAEIDLLTEKISTHLQPILKPAFETFFDVAGGAVDVGRFLSGEPECMVEMRLVEIAQSGRVVTILVNGCFSAGIDTREFRKRGAAIVGLVDALAKCQYSTEVWLEISHKTVSYLVKVKGAEDMLDIDVLMFAIGHEACFRQLNFAIQDGDDKKLHVQSINGMGYVWKLSCAELIGANVCLEPLIWNDPTSNAEEWIKARLAEFGLIREEG